MDGTAPVRLDIAAGESIVGRWPQRRRPEDATTAPLNSLRHIYEILALLGHKPSLQEQKFPSGLLQAMGRSGAWDLQLPRSCRAQAFNKTWLGLVLQEAPATGETQTAVPRLSDGHFQVTYLTPART